MTESSLHLDDFAVLIAASSKLAQATTPDMLLEAVSGYARDEGASSGTLIYLHSEADHPVARGEIVAEWVRGTILPIGVGVEIRYDEYPQATRWVTQYEPLMFIEDLRSDARFSPEARLRSLRYNRVSAAILALYNQGRRVGLIYFAWDQPRQFTERDKRIYTALVQQAAPVIDSQRLLELSRTRAARAELLLQINTALSRATNEAEIVEALVPCWDKTPPHSVVLSYLDVDELGKPTTVTDVAVWKDGAIRSDDPRLGEKLWLNQAGLPRLWMAQPESLLLIEDFAANPSAPLSETTQSNYLNAGIRSLALLPLHSGGRWQGIILIKWRERHYFNEDETYIYEMLLQTLPSVVASRRGYLAEEEARRESEFLYRISEEINAAKSFGEIARAVSVIDPQPHSTALSIWENYDYVGATYFEIVGTDGEQVQPVGVQYTIDDFPILRTLEHTGVLAIEDISQDPRVDPRSATSWLNLGTRARIGIPLMLNNRWMGLLTFLSQVPRKFTERDKRLAAGIGGLVAAAVDRIRLREETERARQRAEMLAQISAGLTAATDEQGILAAVAPLAEGYGSALCTLAYARADANGNIVEVQTVALRSPRRGPLQTQELAILVFRLADFPLVRLAYEKPNEPIFIDDAMQADPETGVRISEGLSWPTIVVIPLKAGDQWQGILTFFWDAPRTFSPEIRGEFAAIQHATASVVTSRRAYLAQRQRVLELETVAKVSAAATSILNVDDLLNAVVDLMRASFIDYHMFIYLLDDSREYYVRMTAINAMNQSQPVPGGHISVTESESLIAHAGRTRVGVIVNDIANVSGFALAPMLPNARSEMAVPMVAAERLIGVLDVQSQEVNRFTESDMLVMSTLADLIAVAVQNARLYKRAQELAVLEERNRLARELHDSVSQALYGIGLGARTARALLDRDPSRLREPLEYILTLTEAGLTEMRALIFELRPESIENEGLVSALVKQAAAIQARHGIKVKTEFGDEPGLPVDTKESLYRIAREALHNIVKHAHATNVGLYLSQSGDGLMMRITDDGVGFDSLGTFPGHLGLKSMRERAGRLNGSFDIRSEPGSGTQITIHIPPKRQQ